MIISRIQSVTFTVLLLLSQPASFGQKTYDPNLNHFYMGRQQITITDETPLVHDKTTGTAGGASSNGALPGRPVPLPSAGFQSYTPETSLPNTKSLPKVINGVPPKTPPPQTSGSKAKQGKLQSRKVIAGPATTGSPKGVSAYKPYATYSTPSATTSSAQGSANQQSSSNVRGNLLHWARGNRGH